MNETSKHIENTNDNSHSDATKDLKVKLLKEELIKRLQQAQLEIVRQLAEELLVVEKTYLEGVQIGMDLCEGLKNPEFAIEFCAALERAARTVIENRTKLTQTLVALGLEPSQFIGKKIDDSEFLRSRQKAAKK